MASKKKTKEEKKPLTEAEEKTAFEEIKALAKELGYQGVTGLKNTLWAHIGEIRELKKINLELKKFFGECRRDLEIYKSDFYNNCLKLDEITKNISKIVKSLKELNIKKE